MISDAHRAIVTATVPALRLHGRAITTEFYRTLLGSHPELLDYFNPANQRSGAQADSLAAAVLTYASHIADPAALAPMVERIANKHVSLQVRPEHYPIVGQHLLAAIATVLGEAATPEILAAWAEAYGVLADVMIGRETTLDRAGAAALHGWAGFRALRVVRKTAESDVMTSFTLAAPDGSGLPDFIPGQYVSVRVRAPGFDHDQVRQYSLSAAPNGRTYRISVNREPQGLVSNFLHDRVGEGDLLHVHAPLGDFHLQAGDAPVLLLSGGSGITVMLSMLESLTADPGDLRPVAFLHAARDRGHHAFGTHVRALALRRPNVRVGIVYRTSTPADELGVHHDHSGRLMTPLLLANLLPGSLVYSCGPAGFMAAVEDMLDQLRVPRDRQFSEAFAPDPSFAARQAVAA